MPTYREARTQSRDLYERNDCAVVAVAVATDIDYETVHAMFAKAGRRPRCGTMRWVTDDVLDTMVEKKMIKSYTEDEPVRVYRKLVNTLYNYQTGEWKKTREYREGQFSMKTIADQYPKSQPFIAFVSRHCAAVIDGEVQDWTKGRTHRVKHCYLINR